MFNKQDKNSKRVHRHKGIRSSVSGTAKVPRLCVYRSLNEIYVQLIDDQAGNTLASASSKDKELESVAKGKTKVEIAEAVGREIAKKAKKIKIKSIVFDRGGYVYTGRVKAIADGARAEGLQF